MYELPQETPYEFKTLNFPQFNKNLYYRMTDLCAIYVLYLFFFFFAIFIAVAKSILKVKLRVAEESYL